MALTDEGLAAIRGVLDQLEFAPHLSPGEMKDLLAGFEKQRMKKGDVLITEGKSGEVFYVLGSGAVGIYRKGKLLDKQIAKLEERAFFGEMSLLTDAPRSASVVCEDDGVVFTLLRRTFQRILVSNPKVGALIRKAAGDRAAATRELEFKEFMGRKL